MTESGELQSRRAFIKFGAIGASGIFVPAPLALFANQTMSRGPALPADLVKEFVIKAHGDLKRTQEMLEEHPGLLNASWDWGDGDFEMGIEGAGHVGSKEIARFLISKGARMTIFVATMLGNLEIVKPMLMAFPEMIHAKGPHGLTFVHHAKKGGEEALPVLEYLKSLGAS